MLRFLLVVLCLICSASAREHSNLTSGKRNERVFSLFSIVQFPNEACTTTSSVFKKGVCFSSTECSSKSGSATGNCAAGFGVCCVFSTSTCGSTMSQNCSYITNPGYPNTYSTTGSCDFTISKSQDDICQLRLDFETLAMGIAPTADANFGCCGSGCTIAYDSLAVTGQTGSNPPKICGINTGYHMYVEMGTLAADTATLSTYLGSGNTGTRQWNVKITQITCTAPWRVPAGCVQYFTGISNNVYSYGHQSAQLLQRQNYNVCTRQELGYCSNVWREAGQSSVSGTATASPDPFSMPDAAAATGVGESSDCPNAYVFISGGDTGTGINTGQSNTWCGEALICDACLTAVISPAGRPSPVATKKFYLGVWSDAGSLVTNPTAAGAAGFNLIYNQYPCSSHGPLQSM